jgi:hypothetical protein
MAVLSVPMLYIKNEFAIEKIFDLLIFCHHFHPLLLVTGRLSKYSWRLQELSNIHYFIYYLLYHSNGFSFHNTIAVLGLWGKKSEFVHSKLNIEELKDKWKQNTYLSQTISKKHNY